MEIQRLSLSGVALVTPRLISDSRGAFSEIFRADVFEAALGPWTFVQDNQSLSRPKGTVRGLHFQRSPRAQGKLVRCQSGAVLDIAVDIRTDSPSFGQHVAVELSADNRQWLWIPPGFAHGFCSLTPDAVLQYKVTDYYSAPHDAGIYWADPDLKIDWPVTPDEATVSDKDKNAPKLGDLAPDQLFSGLPL